jgi:cation diffusion facilitator family transporter
MRSREGLRAVVASLVVLAACAAMQAVVFAMSGSVALLADLIHNVGDALTALPVGLAFLLKSRRAEAWSGVAVVAAIFISAMFAGYEAIQRFIEPSTPSHLAVLALAGFVGFAGNWVAAIIRTRAGEKLGSAALVADGKHARADAWVSLGVVASAAVVAAGVPIADPVIGLVITIMILRITWHSWIVVRTELRGLNNEDRIDGHSHDHGHDHDHEHSHPH